MILPSRFSSIDCKHDSVGGKDGGVWGKLVVGLLVWLAHLRVPHTQDSLPGMQNEASWLAAGDPQVDTYLSIFFIPLAAGFYPFNFSPTPKRREGHNSSAVRELL